MSTLLDKLKKLSFFTHYPRKHESLTIDNVTEEYQSKEEMWDEWFSDYYVNGKWYIGEPLTIIKLKNESVISGIYSGDFSNSVIDWGDGTIESPSTFTHTYSENKEYIVKVVNAPYSEDFCFYQCDDLISINIPNIVTTLGMSCFYNCDNLISVNIPNTITTLGNYCFHNCKNLIDYYLNWTTSSTIITFDSKKMSNNTNTIFHIPQGTKQLYIDKGYPSDKLQDGG